MTIKTKRVNRKYTEKERNLIIELYTQKGDNTIKTIALKTGFNWNFVNKVVSELLTLKT